MVEGVTSLEGLQKVARSDGYRTGFGSFINTDKVISYLKIVFPKLNIMLYFESPSCESMYIDYYWIRNQEKGFVGKGGGDMSEIMRAKLIEFKSKYEEQNQ